LPEQGDIEVIRHLGSARASLWGINLYPAEFGTSGWIEFDSMNIGSDVGRAARAKELGNAERLEHALDRAPELFDLTLADERWHGRRKEIARTREVVCDSLVGDNEYGSSAESLDAYFLPFAIAARNRRQP
jgi:hypothetical protein